ncbi:MAG TPA: DUF3467 domain-containing protein [Anaerohalosphaeraceae bacterium]|nr:DUF3467 domain-containing protein [Anaerohalosphaeraceae bacterium]HQG05017.1 DUF3467 domain-containing protein [Anaerohalosphaeraceae bacterium]HQI07840.1 DUF3467 domain-containing protein [Anaerohalosphaeraceae bacterium]HQJ68201.1 DUF3467 domain-containing protein [Anaerohalosphaeraceae bacterium]
MAKKTITPKNPTNENTKMATMKDTEKNPVQGDALNKVFQFLAKNNEVMAGDYCNVAMIHHSEREFVLDFIFAMANQHFLVSRVITNPQHVKNFCEVLGDNIKQYEKKFGEIKI